LLRNNEAPWVEKNVVAQSTRKTYLDGFRIWTEGHN